jgi:membrane protein DedA with SNARE-associated domain
MEFISVEKITEIAHQYGYLAVFLGILLENIGIPLPGETITIVGGFLAGSKELNYGYVLASAIAGASLGGTIGYWIGRKGGWGLLVKIGKIFRISEEKLLNLKNEFGGNAGKAVFVGRFIALLRVFASPLAGVVEMPFLKFTAYNLLGAATWATVMVSIAFFAGKVISLEELVAWAAKFAFLALGLVAAWILIPMWLESRQVEKS